MSGATVRQQREAWLKSIGMDVRTLNKSIRRMVDADGRRDLKKSLKKAKSRRATKEWKRRHG